MKKRKIALVYDAIYPYVKGGGERRFYELGKRLVNKNTEVHLYGMKFWEGPAVIERDGMILHGLCKARPLYTKGGRRSISQAVIFGLSAFKLLTADYDVIDCCGFPYFSLFPAKLSALIKRKPLYATWHEVWGKRYWREYLGILGFIGFYIELAASRLPNCIIVNSNHTAESFRNELRYKDAIAVVPAGIDTKTIATIKPAKNGSDLIYAGRLMDFKNINFIIEALAQLKEKGINLTCTIIGEGPHKTKLQTLAKKLGVTSQIHWLGFLEDSNDVYAHMKSAKVFVLPSLREGFGIVAVEANACGTPVLIANHKANAAKGLIKHAENGYIFEPTIEGLSEGLEKTLASTKEMEKKAIKFAKNFDWHNSTKKQAEVYSQ